MVQERKRGKVKGHACMRVTVKISVLTASEDCGPPRGKDVRSTVRDLSSRVESSVVPGRILDESEHARLCRDLMYSIKMLVFRNVR